MKPLFIQVLSSTCALMCFCTTACTHYPEKALFSGIEGWAEVEYSVNADCDLIVVVRAAEPKGVFEESTVANTKRMLLSERQIIDWTKIPDIHPPNGPVWSQTESKMIMAKVDAYGPWPVERTIVDHKSDNRIVCNFDANGALQSAHENTIGSTLPPVQLPIHSESMLLPTQIFRFYYQKDD